MLQKSTTPACPTLRPDSPVLGLVGGHQYAIWPLPSRWTDRAFDELARHDIVMQTESGWRFTVELMRRWVKRF